MRAIRAYAVVDEGRKVLVLHLDLDESWWSRGNSHWERDMKDIEDVLRGITGKRLWRRHHLRGNLVEFRIPKNSCRAAAVALRMTYKPDADYEPIILKRWNALQMHDRATRSQ